MVDTRFSVSLQIMVTLAYHSDELVNSAFLAKILKTNPTFVRKLVSQLVAAHLVESFRGQGGGIKLARTLENINLKEIYLAAIEDKPLIARHKKPIVKSCVVSCSIENLFCEVINGIEKSTQEYLQKKTLSDIVKKISKT